MQLPLYRRAFEVGLIGLAVWLSGHSAAATPTFQQAGNLLVMSNGDAMVEYNLSSGTADFYWRNAKKISGFYSAVILNGSTVAATGYANHGWAVVSGNQVVVTNTGNGLPMMSQYFALDQTNSFLTRVQMTGSAGSILSANWMAPLVMNTAGGVDIGSYEDDRALFVPFDNDHFVRYNAESINGSDIGNEVGAFYDNGSRNGLVVGSVTHDTWKTGVSWSGSSNKLNQLTVFGGVTNHWTWDVMAHGSISGNVISSPTIMVGFGPDWRAMLEEFGTENLSFAPKLQWSGLAPFGWNSWGIYQANINYATAIAVSDSIHTNLQSNNFNENGVVYVNLDSYWNNLDNSQLQSFTAHCHANGQKAGVYWGPFDFFGNANDATNYYVPPDYTYRYSDILLKDGNGNFISNDGAFAIDPTHPATLAMIDYYASYYTSMGFDYVKLDFLSHGALEGVHYNTNITTGIQAFNLGMQRLVGDLGGRMFISESISPLFPYQYGNSRRIACDAQGSKISDTEYTMNSVAYGWWLDQVYSFNDPDIIVFGNGPNSQENQSRLICGAVTSGVFLNGDLLTNAASIALAQTYLTNAAINNVIRSGRSFRPVEGNTGSSAVGTFVRQDSSSWCIAVFNYTGSAVNQSVDLGRAGLPTGVWGATNLLDGSSMIVSGSLNVSLNAKQSKLYRLTSIPAFAVSITPSSQIVNSGGSATYNISVVSNDGFADNVTLSASGLPATISANFSPMIVTAGSGSSTLTVTVSSATPAASYPFMIVGTSPTMTNTASAVLNVAVTLADIVNAPTPGPFDISQLGSSGNQQFPGNLNYYDNNGSPPGQTFTTGSNPSGYILSSVAIKTAGIGSFSGISTAQPYSLRIYSMSGTAATLLATCVSGNVAFSDGDWLQWIGLTNVLNPNTTYAYSFQCVDSIGYEAMSVASGNSYSGGQIALVPTSGGTINTGNAGTTFDATFNLGINPPGVPAIISVSSSPSGVAYAGTPVALGEVATGSSPVYYTWQTDNGSGGASFSNLSAASTNASYALDTTPLTPGVYRFRVIVSNSVYAVTSGVVNLSLVAASGPIISSNPVINPANAYVGTTARLNAAFNGTQPISYQWQFTGSNGEPATPVPGATNPVFILTNLQFSAAGEYFLTATNAVGGSSNVSSSEATLTVLAQPAPFCINFAYWNAGASGEGLYNGPGAIGSGTYWNQITGDQFNQASVTDFSDNGITHLYISLTARSSNWATSSGGIPLLESWMITYNVPQSFTFSNVPNGIYNLALYGVDGSYANQAQQFQVNGLSQQATNDTYASFVEHDNYVVFTNLMVIGGTLSGIYQSATGGEGDFNGAQLQLIGPVSPPAQLVINSVTLSGSSLILNGANGIAGKSGVLLASTNLSLPVNEWTPVATNMFGGSNFSLTNTVNPDLPRMFYLLKVP